MAISEDGSTPAAVTNNNASGSVTVTSNSFSPPANCLLVVMVSCGFSGAAPSFSISSTIGGAPSFTAGPSGSNGANWTGIWTLQQASAPGSITITATDNTSETNSSAMIDVRVVLGANTVQTGAATIPATGASSTALQGTLTPSTLNSWVYICGHINNAESGGMTPLSNTTTINNKNDTTARTAITGRLTNPVGSLVSTTLGWTAATSSGWVIVGLEILAAPAVAGALQDVPSIQPGPAWYQHFKPYVPRPRQTDRWPGLQLVYSTESFSLGALAFSGTQVQGIISIDGTTPPVVQASATSVTVTTASFKPPANALLVAIVSLGYSTGAPVVTMSSTIAGNPAWTTGPFKDSLTGSWAGIFTYQTIGTVGSITVTVTDSTFQSSQVQLALLVITGAASSQAGAASASFTSYAANFADCFSTIQTTTIGSWVFIATQINNPEPSVTPDANTTTYAGNLDSTGVLSYQLAGYQSFVTFSPGAIQLGWTPANIASYSWAALEILPAGGTSVSDPVNDFQGAAAPAAITTGNSADALSRAFDLVTTGSGTSLTYTTAQAAHSSQAALITFGSVANQLCYAGWNSFGTGQTAYFRLYLYFTANPSGSVNIFQLLQANGAQCCAGWINSTGHIFVNDATNSNTLLTFTSAIPLNSWFRIEGNCFGDSAAGSVTVSRYNTKDSTTATETQISVGSSPGGGSYFFQASGPPGQHATLQPSTLGATDHTYPRSDSAAAAMVSPVTERIPANATANNTPGPQDPTTIPWGPSSTGSGLLWTNYLSKATGHFVGTTDEIFQWGCFKWGLEELYVKAEAVRESSWHQSEQGDTGLSQSILQIRAAGPNGVSPTLNNRWGGYPLTHNSTPLAVDFFCAYFRGSWNGFHPGFPTPDGTLNYYWGIVGSWFAGSFQSTSQYVSNVQAALAAQTWTSYGSISPRPAPGGTAVVNTGGPISQMNFGVSLISAGAVSTSWYMDDIGVVYTGPLGPFTAIAGESGNFNILIPWPIPGLPTTLIGHITHTSTFNITLPPVVTSSGFLPTAFQYLGHYGVYYLDYVDVNTRKTLIANPGQSYTMLPTDAGAVPPPDSSWNPPATFSPRIFLRRTVQAPAEPAFPRPFSPHYTPPKVIQGEIVPEDEENPTIDLSSPGRPGTVSQSQAYDRVMVCLPLRSSSSSNGSTGTASGNPQA